MTRREGSRKCPKFVKLAHCKTTWQLIATGLNRLSRYPGYEAGIVTKPVKSESRQDRYPAM